MATFVQQSDEVLNRLNQLQTIADQWIATTTAALNSANAALETQIQAVQTAGIDFDVTGVNTTFNAPSATEPTVPSSTTVSIGDTEWNQIYADAADRLSTIGISREYEASNRAAAWGSTQLDETGTVLLAKAENDTDGRTSEVALKSATDQARAAREDIIALSGLELTQYKDIMNAETASENSRVQYEQLELTKAIDTEEKDKRFDFDIAVVNMEKVIQHQLRLLEVYAQLAAALLQASDVSLHSQVGISLSGAA